MSGESTLQLRKILTYLKRQSIDVSFIQETHLSDAEHVKLRRDWVGHVYHSSFNTKARGVAILINKKMNFKLISIEKDSNGRFIFVKGELNFNDLVLKLATAEGHCMVGSDFNLILDPNLDQSTPRSSNRSKAASVLLRGIWDCVTFGGNLTQKLKTFHSFLMFTSRIPELTCF